jgi:hypothetical protein
MHGAHFRYFQTHPRIMVDVSQEVPTMIPGLKIDTVIPFVNVNQRKDIRPPSRIDRATWATFCTLTNFLESISGIRRWRRCMWPRGSGVGPPSAPSSVFGRALLTSGLLLA